MADLSVNFLTGPTIPKHDIEGSDVTAFIKALPLIRQHKERTAVVKVSLLVLEVCLASTRNPSKPYLFREKADEVCV